MFRVMQSSSGVEKGNVYGKWLVLGCPFKVGTKDAYVVCKCKCGTVSAVRCGSLSRGGSNQCLACNGRDVLTRHGGAAPGRVERLYEIRWGMLKRCYGEYHMHYHNYGGRGIGVCDEWRESYESFRDWAKSNGYQDGLTLDRINNDGNYEPSNCRWVTYERNCRNTRRNVLVGAFGVSKCVADWADDARCVVARETLRQRLRNGWKPEEAITTPSKGKRLCV
jgi:hypothetical protein